MEEHLRQRAEQADNDLVRGCVVQVCLQARILESVLDQGLFLRWAFRGGKALRVTK